MPDLQNSQRRLLKATYVPFKLDSQAQQQSGRAVEKAMFVRSLGIQPAELQALAKNSDVRALTVAPKKSGGAPTSLIDVVRPFSSRVSSSSLKTHGPVLARATTKDLVTLGNAVAHLRRGAQSAAAPVPASAATTTADPPDAAKTEAIVQQFQYQSPITPVGRIHLERLEMTPVGVEHGELVHSVPLSPKETVNVAHREWSVTTQTFESLTQDSLEGFSETGVAEKSDLSQASDVESKHSSSLDVNGSISATYNGGAYSLTASAAMDYSDKNEVDQSDKRSIAHSIAITRSASTRTKKEHKTTFRVSSVAGAEDLAVQVITNDSSTQAMRVDYYQLLRKWRVDLIRYGLRMTYDIAIPNPGLNLISKVVELESLNRAIAESYTFKLDPTTIGRDNWQLFEQNFTATVDPPPKESVELEQTAAVPQQTYDKWGSATVQFDIPEGYVIMKAHLSGQFSLYSYGTDARHLQVRVLGEQSANTNTATGEYEGGEAPVEWDLTDATLIGRSGTAFLVINFHNVDFGNAVIDVTAEPTDAAMQTWQSKVWSQLHEADQTNYEARLALMQDRKKQLESELAAFDALTLRKMEREEVMQWTLRWLLGPHFVLMPDTIQGLITNSDDPKNAPPSGRYAFPPLNSLQEPDYQEFVQHSELIKYLHNAIEWENVIFFAYPYFWDRLENWEFKRFLVHPDPIHRQFLRAGYARVVLPVRPGFETSFAMLMETGDATAPPDATYPYVSIGEETRNFAMTNYEGIPPANPDHNVRTLLYPQQRTAWADIQNIMRALEQYHADNANQYPSDLKDPKLGQAAQAAGVPLPVTDPWGNPYDYATPGIYGDYDLASHGTDKHPEVDGLDAAITSWAEGSVVGRWYEYTPTSALDVAVTMIPLDQTPLLTHAQPA